MKLSNIEIKWLSPTSLDVFVGKGWYNWTRFNIKRIKGKVYLEKVNGGSLDAAVFKQLCKDLETTEME